MLWLSQNEKIHWWGGRSDPWMGGRGKKDEDKGYKEYKKPRVKKNVFLSNKQNSNKHVTRYLDVNSRMIFPQFYLILSSSLYLFT